MNRLRLTQKEGSGLLEVVIVVVSVALLAAVSIPRMSRGSGSPGDSTTTDGLAALRNAIDQYAAEHGGVFPTVAEINRQLTQYTDISGAVSETRSYPYVYGPYLRSIPVMPVGVRAGNSKIAASDAEDVGWLYSGISGTITVNTATELDDMQGLFKVY